MPEEEITTIEELARAVKKGFDATATKADIATLAAHGGCRQGDLRLLYSNSQVPSLDRKVTDRLRTRRSQP
jgi:hypothetical protein